MKKFNYLFVVAVVSLFFSCQDEMFDKKIEIESSDNLLSGQQFERLSFDSDIDLEYAINNPDLSENKALTRSSNFVSLMSPVPIQENLPQKENMIQKETYYQKLGYETLIPNQGFARLVNPLGEVAVKDTIYKITPNGTYFFHKSMGSKFAQIYKSDSIGQPMSEDLYALADGIYRYDTFKGSEEEEEVDLSSTETIDWDAIDNDGDELTITRAGTPEPNYNSFPIFRAERHTWLGKIRQKVLGKDKYYSVKLSKKRRVRGRFYAYNYVIYSEAGVTGMMQKKNWIGWSKTTADELRIEWKNTLFRVKLKDHSLDGIPALPNELNGAGVHNMKLPDGSIEKTIILYNKDIKPSTIDKWFGKGLKEGLKAMHREWGSTHVPNDYDKIQAAIIADRSSIIIIPKDEKRNGYNTKSMTHIFAKKVHFMITINPQSLPSNVGSWVKSLQGSLGQEFPKLEKGEAIICGRLGNNWRGMKIISK